VSVLVSSWSDDEDDEEEEETRKEDEEQKERKDEYMMKDAKKTEEKEREDEEEMVDDVQEEGDKSTDHFNDEHNVEVIEIIDDVERRQQKEEEESQTTFGSAEVESLLETTGDADSDKKFQGEGDYNSNTLSDLGVASRADNNNIVVEDVVPIVDQAVVDDIEVTAESTEENVVQEQNDTNDDDAKDFVQKTVETSTSLTSEPAAVEVAEEDDDIETSSLASELDWYQEYVQQQHRLCKKIV
jgi:hypothetical protein